MESSIKKTTGKNTINGFLKVATLSVFGMLNIKAAGSDMTTVGITVGVLFVAFVGAVIWGRMGSSNEG